MSRSLLVLAAASLLVGCGPSFENCIAEEFADSSKALGLERELGTIDVLSELRDHSDIQRQAYARIVNDARESGLNIDWESESELFDKYIAEIIEPAEGALKQVFEQQGPGAYVDEYYSRLEEYAGIEMWFNFTVADEVKIAKIMELGVNFLANPGSRIDDFIDPDDFTDMELYNLGLLDITELETLDRQKLNLKEQEAEVRELDALLQNKLKSIADRTASARELAVTACNAKGIFK